MSDKFFIPLKESSSYNFDGYTLIIPCISVGNVPQLTCDLIISTLIGDNHSHETPDDGHCQLFGYINSDALMPLSGPDPFRFGGNTIATSAQLFKCDAKKLIILQQRSPCFKELLHEYHSSLTQMIHSFRITRVLILTSSFKEHYAATLDSRDEFPMQYMTNDSSLDHDMNELLHLSPVKRVDPYTLTPSSSGVIHLPCSGSFRSLMKILDRKGIQSVAVILYCSEGDNTPHAVAMANKVNQWLNIVDNSIAKSLLSTMESVNSLSGSLPWIEPFSWRKMFGDKPPLTIY